MKRILDDLTIFCAVVEAGSLKAASEQLSVPHSTVSRRIEVLEKSLGLVLLHRTTREVKVTSTGQALYSECSATLETLRHSIDHAIDAEAKFRGRLKVSMPVRAGLDFLGPWLIDFAKQHPDLHLDLSLSNSNKNLVKDEIDLAFRVGPLMDSSAIAIHLWDIPYTVCAHQSYLEHHGLTAKSIDPQQLETLPCVISRPASRWVFVDGQQEVFVTPKNALTVDDLALAYHGVQTGQYMAMQPSTLIVDDDIVEIEVEGLRPRTRIMYAYYLGRRHAQSQIKQLIEYIKDRYTS